MEVRPDEVACLGLMEVLKAPTIGEFHREGFIQGWLHPPALPSSGSPIIPPADTIARQSAYASQLRTAISSDAQVFKRVYRHAFILCKPEGQRNVPAEVATEMWRLFFTSQNGGVDIAGTTPWLDWWINFYETKVKRPVNKDLWNMFGEMVSKIQEEQVKGTASESDPKAGFGWWSEEGAWPGAVDDFVEWVVAKRKESAMDTS